MKKMWILVGVPVAGLGVGLIFHAIPRDKRPAPVERAPVAVVSARAQQTMVATDDRVALQVSALNNEVSALRAELARTSQPSSNVKDDAEVRLQTPEQARQTWREHMEQVAVEFELEARDARWAREAESKIQGVLATSRAMSDAVESLDCRSASCRVQLKANQSTNFEEDLLRVVHEVGSFLPDTQLDAADPALGKRSTVIYLRTKTDEVTL
jgi:hypothetical protein